MICAQSRIGPFSVCRLAAIAVIAITPGCVGTVANLIHAVGGNMVPAKFDGLRGRRVAVVCVSETSMFGPSTASQLIGRKVSQLLRDNVREIEVIQQQTIQQWTDENDWNQIDYLEIGKGVGAEVLVAIDLESFGLHEGQTMYKGRADVGITVYDLTDEGREVYSQASTQIQYPVTAGIHTADISEREFRRRFIDTLSRRIARHFYAYEVKEDFAVDRTLLTP